MRVGVVFYTALWSTLEIYFDAAGNLKLHEIHFSLVAHRGDQPARNLPT